MKFSGYVGYDTRNNLEHFGDDRLNPLGIGFIFFIFWVRGCWQHHGIPGGWTFMKFSGYGHKKQ